MLTDKYTEALTTEPIISGYVRPTLNQVLAADQYIWTRVGERTEGACRGNPTTPRVRLGQPRGSGTREKNGGRESATRKDQGGWDGASRKRSVGAIKIPPGLDGGDCVPATTKGQRICFGFNLGNCREQGNKCDKGLHICRQQKCFQGHAYCDRHR